MTADPAPVTAQCPRCHRTRYRTHRHCIWHWLGNLTGWT
jgi:hypothetical protein